MRRHFESGGYVLIFMVMVMMDNIWLGGVLINVMKYKLKENSLAGLAEFGSTQINK